MKEFKFYPTGKMIDEDGNLKEIPKGYFEWWRESKGPDGEVVDRQLVGQYWHGMSYNCTARPGHDPLRAMCKAWAKKGMIRIQHLAEGEKFIVTEVG